MILVIVTLRLARLGRDRRTCFADQLRRALVETDDRPLRVGRLGIQVKHILHSRDIFAVDLRNAPHVTSPRLEVVLGQTPPDRLARHRAWSVSRTISPASRSSVQRLRPAGGLEQAAATSSAVSFPDSLRAAPGRASSLRAASRLPSTKRRLVRYTVEPPTETTRAISSSPTPASAARRICARLSLRAACLPPPSIAVSWARSASSSSTL